MIVPLMTNTSRRGTCTVRWTCFFHPPPHGTHIHTSFGSVMYKLVITSSPDSISVIFNFMLTPQHE